MVVNSYILTHVYFANNVILFKDYAWLVCRVIDPRSLEKKIQ